MVKELRTPRPRAGLNMTTASYNLSTVWKQATPAEIHAGYTYWYQLHRAMRDRAMFSGVPWWRVAGLMAAMSPNNSQDQNLRAVDRLLQAQSSNYSKERLYALKIPCYGRDKEKAIKILSSHYSVGCMTDVEAILKGQKVVAFYRNMHDPDNKDRVVTIDGHMMNMLRIGYHEQDSKRPPRLQAVRHINSTEYKLAQEVVQRAADAVEVPPSHFQAVVWLTWKRLHKLAHDPQGRLWI